MLDEILYSIFGSVILSVILRMIYGPDDCRNEARIRQIMEPSDKMKRPWEIELKVEQRPGGPMSRCPCSSKQKD